MKSAILLLVAAFATLAQGQNTTASCAPITQAQVRGFFTLWNNALATLDSANVTARYAKNAVLLPTVSDIPRNTTALIKNYFDSFLLKKPQGVILSSDVITGCNWA